ncbi:MAG TPA: glycosyltransferase, partial [Planctomycetota bacterium]|nr:glycosyltransferase [Planctomycetota bacterium]
YYPPPAWFADLAADAGISLLIGIPWQEHICGVGEYRFEKSVRLGIRDAVGRLRGHPAVLGYLVGNEIPTQNVRWHGPESVERFLGELYDVAKNEDEHALVSYANYPPTEYISLEKFDFYTLNVYLHAREKFRGYLQRLRNLAGHKPFILGEFGVDAIREGEEHQAEIIRFSLEEAFRNGVAGAFVFSWTDEWFRGGSEVEGWAFGLTTRDRAPRPSAFAVADALRQPEAPLPRYPKVSVVVATYNGGATLRETLETLGRMTYPDYEVIVIDDGSKDDSAAIAREFVRADPSRNGNVVLIQQPNKGLSAARNRGIEAATGEIVAYCDSDVAVDPDWLYYLVSAMGTERGPLGGAGGPNLPPPGDGRIAAAVAASPGGPTHVLVDDVTAEHVPGCNMAFWKSALVEVGGFDPRFHAAGDDVDICWRIQDRGLKLGYAPSAIVWHHRRNSAKAYLRQQRGYGEAEAELAAKHPGRYNAFGGALWRGRIYAGTGEAPALLRRPRIHYGVFGLGLFQTIYQPDEGILVGLAQTPEWTVLGALALAGGLVAGKLALATVGLLFLAAQLYLAARRAWRSKLEPQYDNLGTRALVLGMTIAQPWVRRIAQLRNARRLRHRVLVNESLRAAWFGQNGGECSGFWSENGGERESFLGNLEGSLAGDRFPVHRGTGFEPFDLEVAADEGATVCVSTVMEYHGGPKRLLRVRVEHRISSGAAAALCLGGAASLALFSFSVAAGFIGAGATLVGLYHFRRRGRWLQNAVEARVAEVARKLGFSPVPAPRGDRKWWNVMPLLFSVLP